MQPLWRLCEKLGDRECSQDLQRMVYTKELKNGEQFSELPLYGSAMEMANKYCISCKTGLFKLEENVCPVCDKPDFEKEVGPIDISNDTNQIVASASFKECKNCHIKLKIVKQF